MIVNQHGVAQPWTLIPSPDGVITHIQGHMELEGKEEIDCGDGPQPRDQIYENIRVRHFRPTLLLNQMLIFSLDFHSIRHVCLNDRRAATCPLDSRSISHQSQHLPSSTSFKMLIAYVP